MLEVNKNKIACVDQNYNEKCDNLEKRIKELERYQAITFEQYKYANMAFKKGQEMEKKDYCFTEPESSWIKIKDRLPTESEVILAVNSELPYEQRVAQYACFTEGKFIYDWSMNDDDYREIENVTHWMPLPLPPEDKQ